MSNVLSAKDKSLINKWYQLAALSELLAELEHKLRTNAVDQSQFKSILGITYPEMVDNQLHSVMSELTVISQLVVEEGLTKHLDKEDNQLILELISKLDNNEHIEQQEQVLTPNTRIH